MKKKVNLSYNMKKSCSRSLAVVVFFLWSALLSGQIRTYNGYDNSGTFLVDTFSEEKLDSSDIFINESEFVLWQKNYDYMRVRSLALGYDKTIFFGGSDSSSAEAALYSIHNQSVPPVPLWTYIGSNYSIWYVEASQDSDIFAGINYLPKDLAPDGNGYCTFFVWGSNSNIPLFSHSFSDSKPVTVEPLRIANGRIFVGVQKLNESNAFVYTFTTNENSILLEETINFSGRDGEILRVSDNANIVGLLQGSMLTIYDRAAQTIRQEIRINAATANFDMCGRGDYLISGWQEAVIHQWDGERYREIFRDSDDDATWYHGYSLLSKDGSTAVITAYRSDYAQNRIYLFNILKKEIVWTYEFSRIENSDLQLIPSQSSISDDGSLFLIGNWGDSSANNPDFMYFKRESNTPIFTLSSSGSIDRTAISNKAPYYAAAGGKPVHMNTWGTGGTLFAIDLKSDIAYASLQGTTSISDTKIILGDWDFTFTDDSGYYSFADLVPGDYLLSAEKKGFYSVTDVPLNLQEGSNNTLNLILNAIPTVTVSGIVRGSDIPDTPLTGASISLSGYENYTTNSNGDFSFPAVYIENTYTLTVKHPNYAVYTSTVTINSQNVILDDIVLAELPFAVENVSAVIDSTGKSVVLAWSEPDGGILREFRYDTGYRETAVGFHNGTKYSVLGAVHRNDSKILSASWNLSGGLAHQFVDIHIFALDSEGYPDRQSLLHKVSFVPSIHEEWNEYEFSQAIIAPNGFLIGLSPSNGGHLGVTIDNGLSVLPNTQYYSFDYEAGWQFTPYSSGNFFIRARGYDYGELVFSDFPSNRLSEEIIVKNRYLTKYQIYRFKEDHLHNSSNWFFLAETDANFFIDKDWDNILEGIYRYAVVSVYSTEKYSAPAFSNKIMRYPYTHDKLFKNYPNPFKDSTKINYSLANPQEVKLSIYNIKGQLIKIIVDSYLTEGFKYSLWNGVNDKGKRVSAGVYFYRLETESGTFTEKMLLLK